MKKYEIDMCNGPLFRKIILFAMPLLLSSVLQLLYNAADIVVVGNFAGKTALAAVGANSSLINLIINLFIGLSIGSSVVVAKCIGAGDSKGAKDAVHTSIALSFISSVISGAVAIIFARRLLLLMDTPFDVIDQAVLYLRIYFIGVPASMLYNFGSAILRALGDTKRPLYFLTISGIINVCFNLLFVIVFHLDVAGVAIATVISQYISAALVIICLSRLTNPCRLNFKEIGMNKESVKEIVKIGLPAGIQGSIFSASNVLIQSSVNSFGSTVVAGNTAAANLEGFTYVGMNSIYQATLNFTGQNVGAGKIERIGKINLVSIFIVTAIGLIMGVSTYLGGNQLLGLYTSDSDAIITGITRLKYIVLPYFICGIMEIMVGSLRGMGCSFTPMTVSIFGSCLLRIAWIYTGFREIGTLDSLYIIYPISWAVTASVHFICYLVVKKRLKKKLSVCTV